MDGKSKIYSLDRYRGLWIADCELRDKRLALYHRGKTKIAKLKPKERLRRAKSNRINVLKKRRKQQEREHLEKMEEKNDIR